MNTTLIIIIFSAISALIGVWVDFNKKNNRIWGVLLTLIILLSGAFTFEKHNQEVSTSEKKDAEELERYVELIKKLNVQLKQVGELDTSISHRLNTQLDALSVLDTQMIFNAEKTKSIAGNLNNASERIAGHLSNFKEFENKLNNEVFEVWILVKSETNFTTRYLESSFSSRILGDEGKDSTYYKSYSRKPFKYKIEYNDNEKLELDFIKQIDFREINWGYIPNRLQGIFNMSDFNKGAIRYSKKQTQNLENIQENVFVTLIKSFPIEHFITNLNKDYLTFNDFINTNILIIPKDEGSFSNVTSVSLYLIGQEKMKKFEYFKNYSDDFIQKLEFKNGWSVPNVLELSITPSYFSNIQFARKQSILTMIE